MKWLRAWLLPACTLLVVLAGAILPEYLSGIQDAALMETVHTDPLASENTFLVQTPSLPQRMELLSRWLALPMPDPEVMSAKELLTEGAEFDAVCGALGSELQKISADLSLPWDWAVEALPIQRVSRTYLQEQLVGAEFYMFDIFVKEEGSSLWAVLDGTEQVLLWLEVGHPAMEKYSKYISPVEDGMLFLDRLGVENRLISSGGLDASFQVEGADVVYGVSLDSYYLKIRPMEDYPATGAKSVIGEFDG